MVPLASSFPSVPQIPAPLESTTTQPFFSTPPTRLLADLKSCTSPSHLKQLHAVAIKSSRTHDVLVAAEILRVAVDHGDLRYAYEVFDQMTEPNCFSWNTLIRAFSEADADQALEGVLLFRQMLNDCLVEPNRYTYPPALKACAAAGEVEIGRQIHSQVLKLGLESDGFVATNLVRMYAVCGAMDIAEKVFGKSALESTSEASVILQNVMIDGYFHLRMVEAARGVFERMTWRTTVSWNAMIAGYAENGCAKEAADVFREMQRQGVKPNYVTLVSALPAISRLGALDLGKWMHAFAEKNSIPVDDVLGSALVDMYAKCGEIDRAIQLFEEEFLPNSRNSVTWSALINGLAMHGRAEEALHRFSQMERSGIIPTDVAFIGVLNACSHAGLVDQGRYYFNKMTSAYGIKPRIEHYGCMVDMLGRAGLLREAEEILFNMPMEPDDVILKALLASCRTHGELEMGIRVGKQLVELAPQDDGCYVLLSNLYASVGDWDAVAKVRMMMKKVDIRKDPGCSWMIVDGISHEFVVEDDSHPRTKEIYSMLAEMASKLRTVGYIFDTSQVLLNVENEEKESMLMCHSEKIAVAFGLISTAPGTELKVVKNLRVCMDCHSSLKLISEIYGRRIVVRDRSRFHHFENGYCSCKDYW